MLHTEATCKFITVVILKVFSISLALAAGLRCSTVDRDPSPPSPCIIIYTISRVFVRVRPQADVLHSELDVLSERYSQKCLELSRTEQSSLGRETELSHKERELEQLRRENQV